MPFDFIIVIIIFISVLFGSHLGRKNLGFGFIHSCVLIVFVFREASDELLLTKKKKKLQVN